MQRTVPPEASYVFLVLKIAWMSSKIWISIIPGHSSLGAHAVNHNRQKSTWIPEPRNTKFPSA